MHIPGKRTIRRLAWSVFRPASELSRRTGWPALSRRLRKVVLNARLRIAANASAPRHEGEWVRLHHEISEPSGYFFSENVVSNEIGFLAPAPALEHLPRGLAFLGVGPEQTLSYLPLLDCPLALLVDVRRDNARLHFLYRALFEEAESRSEWLALLLGRPYEKAKDPGAQGSIEAVIAHATLNEPSEEAFRSAHRRLMSRLDGLSGLLLVGDRRRIALIHRCFWKKQLEITFQLDGPRLRQYPSFLDLLQARSPDGRQLSFLASERAFRLVQDMQRSSRIVPVVGDLGGDFALRELGNELRRRQLLIGALYVSNVEQYLFENGTFGRWVENLRSLPCHPEAVLIRSYPESDLGDPVPDTPRSLLGQVRRSIALATRVYQHPDQKPVHRMPTVTHALGQFLERERRAGYGSFRELVCDTELLRR